MAIEQCFLTADAGHMELFLAGDLHRDVTIGNVLTRAEAQERTAEMMENNKSCLKGDK